MGFIGLIAQAIGTRIAVSHLFAVKATCFISSILTHASVGYTQITLTRRVELTHPIDIVCGNGI
jgi:hypothetical protein